MLEIFALCSCACLACLWCAVVLELTKEKCSRKGCDQLFGCNNSKCSKIIRCNGKEVLPRKSYNKDTCVNNLNGNKHKLPEARNRIETKRKDEERTCHYCHCLQPISTFRDPPFSRSQSFPHLRKKYCVATPCKRACKICREMKQGCACVRDNNYICENSSSSAVCVHRSSCPNLISQGRCCAYDGSPVRYFYNELPCDPYQQSMSPNISKDRRKCYRQGRAHSRRRRCFPRINKERLS